MSEIYLFKPDPELEQDIIALYRAYGKTEDGKVFYRNVPLKHIRFGICSPDGGIAVYDGKDEITISITAVLMFGCANLWPVPVFMFTFMTMSILTHLDSRGRSEDQKESHDSDNELGRSLNSWVQFLHDVAIGPDPNKNRIAHVMDKLRDMFYDAGKIFYESPDAMATFNDLQSTEPESVPETNESEQPIYTGNGVEFVIGDTATEKRGRGNPS